MEFHSPPMKKESKNRFPEISLLVFRPPESKFRRAHETISYIRIETDFHSDTILHQVNLEAKEFLAEPLFYFNL